MRLARGRGLLLISDLVGMKIRPGLHVSHVVLFHYQGARALSWRDRAAAAEAVPRRGTEYTRRVPPPYFLTDIVL